MIFAYTTTMRFYQVAAICGKAPARCLLERRSAGRGLAVAMLLTPDVPGPRYQVNARALRRVGGDNWPNGRGADGYRRMAAGPRARAIRAGLPRERDRRTGIAEPDDGGSE